MQFPNLKSVLMLMIAFCGSSWAADILKDVSQNPNFHLIVVSGAIEPDDDIKFSRVITSTNAGLVLLDSPGGSTVAALEIGRQIKEKNLITAVLPSKLCASACALIWLAGSTRYADDSSVIGFHASYVIRNGKPAESGVGNALVGAYLNELGLPEKAIIFVTRAPPEGIEVLTRFKGEQLGISYRTFSEMRAARLIRRDFRIAARPYDPISAAVSFYRALSEGDGNSAAAHVIPEIRGIGPFNEKNMSDYFGSMLDPLKISSARQVDADTVEVNYTYRSPAKYCNGRAIVETGYFMGATLIKRIKANC